MADFRSDTVTVADDRMREAMVTAEVGDDFYGEDPTVDDLERTAAQIVGKDAGVFLTNGTSANMVALLTLCSVADGRSGRQVLTHATSDIHAWEAHTLAQVAGLQTLPLPGRHGQLDPHALASALAATDPYAPRPAVVAIENTHSASGGRPWSLSDIDVVADLCDAAGVPLYCDGARLFNATVASGYGADEAVARCGAVSISLYKGLGAPMGSVLCGPAAFVEHARVLRRTLGSTFRQAGHLAAAGLVGLSRVAELADDHRRARDLWEGLAQVLPADLLDEPPTTNIVTLDIGADAGTLVDSLSAAGVRVTEVVPGVVRFVTHRDLTDADIDAALRAAAATFVPLQAGATR
ncbi:threonine aldolase family protein [Solicola gregarius]|uniref:Aminotransferase class I/II-fold pyridoxal phosphate-dependent enzyme n=1 Tax=Solicola gregarius TaxID=2908642 RepID=A0AA46TEC4_9ACTN|nr:GntG family PLP-dependent aldolase [Solicola gregarius]UYM03633.1 aminotransferase class I/II-fold pyridoxal phosphate-dependent enzyme [Solicola gregarius]